ncbi:hypothetical protein ACXR0O_08460 [Verrucomicrobiota bacterium sgz303538]
MLVVTGAGGTDEYGAQFQDWAKQWQQVATSAGVQALILRTEDDANHREKLQEALKQQSPSGTEPLWLVLLGHGTWDGKTAKFNLRGDDISAAEFAEWLKPFERPVIVIAGFSSSGAWLAPLAGPGRIVLTATRSGSEENFARFGQYLPASLMDISADLDKDGQVSLLEAWITAAKRVSEFYIGEGRLATEHALIEDNADGKGTPPDWFKGVRAVKKSKDNALPDGLRAHQIHLIKNPAEKALPAPLRVERDALELEIAKLRDAKATMDEATYYRDLEALLLKLAKVYAD